MNALSFFLEETVERESPITAPASTKKEEETDTGLFSFFLSKEASEVKIGGTDEVTTEKKKRGRPPTAVVNVDEIITSSATEPSPTEIVSGTNYRKSYAESTALIRSVIAQADDLSSSINKDLSDIRNSKTLKSKYTYITNLTSSSGSLLSTKVAAIRELNSTITQIHNLELNRLKTLKEDKSDQNDDMRMMDLYNAFVNAPLGTYTPQVPNAQDLTLGVNSADVNAVEMISPSMGPTGGLTPEQRRMRMETNPNIQTVVRYNQTTGQRGFDVIDKTTGESVANYPRPDAFLLEDTTIDVAGGIARNRNINMVWPLMLEGSNKIFGEY